MKVWIVFTPSYGDNSPIVIFDSLEKARDYVVPRMTRALDFVLGQHCARRELHEIRQNYWKNAPGPFGESDVVEIEEWEVN